MKAKLEKAGHWLGVIFIGVPFLSVVVLLVVGLTGSRQGQGGYANLLIALAMAELGMGLLVGLKSPGSKRHAYLFTLLSIVLFAGAVALKWSYIKPLVLAYIATLVVVVLLIHRSSQ